MELCLKTFLWIALQPFANCKVTLDFFNFTGDENYITDFQSKMFKDHAGLTHVNASGNLLADFFSGIMEVSIIGWRGVRSPESEKVVFKGNIDICDMTKGIIGGFIKVFVYSYVDKYSNMKILCPMPKGHYYLRNSPFDIEKYLPPFWIESGSWEIFVRTKVKLTEDKPLQFLFDFKAYGTVS